MPRRRVLMIAHHFPPAAGSGANRALAFARYLPERGWQPTVVTPESAWAAPRDDALALEIPSDVRVVRTRSFESRPHINSTTPSASVTPPKRSALRTQVGHLKR